MASRFVLLFVLAITPTIPAAADTLTFALTVADANFITPTPSSGYSASYSASGYTASKTAGTGNGSDYLESV